MSSRRGVTRRAVLAAGVTAALAAVWRRLQVPPTQAVHAIRARLPHVPTPLPPLPADPASQVRGLSPLVTPTADFYRIDIADPIPEPSVDAWRLRIDGLVEHPLEFTFDQLVARGLVEVDATIACVSNWVGGPLVGNARWTGVRLDALIAEARPLPGADEVMGHSVDDFTAGFPLSVLDGRPALVAVGMNGKPLPPEHGYPARIIVPGLYGYVSAVKWLARIELTRFDTQVGYWVPRGWSREAPIKLSSRIDWPGDGSLPNAKPVASGQRHIAGVAWSGLHGIRRVEVRVDDGPWLEAELGPELAATTWRQWWLPWAALPGRHTITVRAEDEAGNRQSTQVVPSMPNGAEGLHQIVVEVSAGASGQPTG